MITLKIQKILIVDDEADLREMVTSILEQDGFKTIKTAGTVAEALKICRDWEPDLAILDVMLPRWERLFLCLNKCGLLPKSQFSLTARGEDEDKLKGLGLGADDYMVKSRSCQKNYPCVSESFCGGTTKAKILSSNLPEAKLTLTVPK